MPILNDSRFLDLTSFGFVQDTTQSVEAAYSLSSVAEAGDEHEMLVALVLPRANDPAPVLDAGWGERQEALAALSDDELWDLYGADEALFDETIGTLQDLGIEIVSGSGYITSPESRTIWTLLDATDFEALFNQTLMVANPGVEGGEFPFWEGLLETPEDLDLAGLWVEADVPPAPVQAVTAQGQTLEPGFQGVGNALELGGAADLDPAEIADLYSFPLDDAAELARATGTVGLIEPIIGSALETDSFASFTEALRNYQSLVGVPEAIETFTIGEEFQRDDGARGERNLDVGVIAGVTPHAQIGIYAGAERPTLFSAYHSAVWTPEDDASEPDVFSSSFGFERQRTPGSPFDEAIQELFVDAALMNKTILMASGDQGSNGGIPNGLTNAAQPFQYVTQVGGTSISNQSAAEAAESVGDAALADILEKALSGDLQTIRGLIAGGMKSLPDDVGEGVFLESVWNGYLVDTNDDPAKIFGYTANEAGTGGVVSGSDVPEFQSRFGLTPERNDPAGGFGRGVPDVAALSAGNTLYNVPGDDFSTLVPDGGTSAAAPLWAALTLQVNTIFEAQGLPPVGFANPLLYQAAAVSPGAFNDILIGDNVSSYAPHESGTRYQAEPPGRDGTQDISATGFGYEAEPGFDLVSGLGTPNGVLLTHAVTTIGHAQLFHDVPAVLGQIADVLFSGSDQRLSIQVRSEEPVNVALEIADVDADLVSDGTDEFAWSSHFAQQVLQEDFSPELVTLYDGFEQGAVVQADVPEDLVVGVEIDGASADPVRLDYTTDFGFVDFIGADRDELVSLARPVATATTIGGADDQTVTITARQNGKHEIAVAFYRVDDYAGTIDGIAPGEPGYEDAAFANGYSTEDGDIWVEGAGFGEFTRDAITGVDSGDLIAMVLEGKEGVFWAFEEMNEVVDGEHVNHLWNYGMNTWGWEDLFGGGDRDFNDLVVRMDFTDFNDFDDLALLA
jgi:hypothetical protein